MVGKITVVSYCHEAHKKWIPFWADQLQKQTFRDFDIIFVAHNWKWDSSKEIAEWNKNISRMDDDLWSRIATYEYQSPPVIGDVIDFAASKVETEFMAHMDLDDIIHPDRLRLQSEFLDANPDTDFLGTRMVGFYGDPKPEMLELSYVEPNEPNVGVTTHDQIKHCIIDKGQNCLGHTTMMYRPGVLKTIGGFSRSDVKLDGKSPDFETWKKAIMAGHKFHRLLELCALWRLDSSSIRHV
tara:strand:+ start:151 stop:870 length:720 start_codon:yes stop_codon:yes gene_type:complete